MRRLPFLAAVAVSICACVGDDTTSRSVVESTIAPAGTDASDPLASLPGVEPIGLTVSGDDPARPTFEWTVPAAAVSYLLVVQSETGIPLWAWSGAENQVVLGGAPRATDVQGPTLTDPSRARVYAFDASDSLVGISAWISAPGA